jgi:hypothetical protein
MGVYEGRGQLSKAMKDLMNRWYDAKSKWDDAMSKSIETDHLVPLEMDLRNAVGAMEHIAQVLAQVKQECQ